MDDIFTIPSFGYNARIGDIYDYKLGKFMPDKNIFSKELPESLIATAWHNSTKSDFLTSNNFFDKAEKLDINPEVSLNVFLKLIKVSGSGIYLKEKPTNSNLVHFSFVYKITKCEEMIDFKNARLQPYFRNNIGNVGTHVVGCITHGANAVISISYDNITDLPVEVIHDYFKTKVRELLGLNDEDENEANLISEGLENTSVSTDESAESRPLTKTETESNKAIKLTDKPSQTILDPKHMNIKVYTDVPGIHEVSESSLQEAIEILRQLPTRMYEAPDVSQKGTQLQYHLLPLSMTNQALISIDQDFNRLEDELIGKLISFFKEIDQIETELSNLKEILDKYKKYFKDEEHEKLCENVRNFFKYIKKLKDMLKGKIQDYREDSAQATEIEELKKSFEGIRYKDLKEFLKSSEYINEKIAFIKKMIKLGIQVFVEDAELDDFKKRNRDLKILVLFFDYKTHKDSSNWNETLEFFLSEHNKSTSNILFLCFDMAMLKREIYNQELRICQIFNGRVVCYDVIKENSKKSCFVMCDMEFEPIIEPNPKRMTVDIRCPGAYGESLCSIDAKEWYCQKCQESIEYGFDNRFYCYCGCQKIEHYCFKCNDERHEYIKFDVRLLQDLLEKMKKKKEINILLIGESGTGKSTWLNLIPYYLTCESLDEAQEKDITKMNLIPSKFTIECDGIKQAISIGSSLNERNKETESATQYPRSYTFKHNRSIYRFIDTPGIGDTRGKKQDQTNLQYITDYAVKFGSIHAICVFFQFDKTRLNKNFKYCFQELLAQLHISAAKNMQFFFTFSNGRDYMRLNTNAPLNKLLDKLNKERNMDIKLSDDRCYLFDNEQYRYLCSIKHKINHSQKAIKDYKEYYLESRSTFFQFLKKSTEASPYQTKNSVSISYSRKLVVDSIVPLTLLKTNLTILISQLRLSLIKKVAAGSFAVGLLSLFLSPAIVGAVVSEILFFGTFVRSCSTLLGAVGTLASFVMRSEKIKGWKISQNRICCKKCVEKRVFEGQERYQFLEVDPNAIDVDPYTLEIYRDLKQRGNASRDYYCENCENNYEYFVVRKSIVEESAAEMEARQTQDRSFVQVQKDLDEQVKIIERSMAEFAVFLQKFTLTTYEDLAEITLKKVIKEEDDKKIKKEIQTHLENYIKAKEEVLKNYDETNIEARLNDIDRTIKELQGLKDVGLIIRILINRSAQGKPYKQEENNNNEPEEIHFFHENV